MEAATKETFPEANLLLKAPPGEEDRVYDLAVHRYELGYISRWQPTEAERAAIAAGGPVWVSVWCRGGPPPIAVFGTTPFQQLPEPQPGPALDFAVSDEDVDAFVEGLEKS